MQVVTIFSNFFLADSKSYNMKNWFLKEQTFHVIWDNRMSNIMKRC